MATEFYNEQKSTSEAVQLAAELASGEWVSNPERELNLTQRLILLLACPTSFSDNPNTFDITPVVDSIHQLFAPLVDSGFVKVGTKEAPYDSKHPIIFCTTNLNGDIYGQAINLHAHADRVSPNIVYPDKNYSAGIAFSGYKVVGRGSCDMLPQVAELVKIMYKLFYVNYSGMPVNVIITTDEEIRLKHSQYLLTKFKGKFIDTEPARSGHIITEEIPSAMIEAYLDISRYGNFSPQETWAVIEEQVINFRRKVENLKLIYSRPISSAKLIISHTDYSVNISWPYDTDYVKDNSAFMSQIMDLLCDCFNISLNNIGHNFSESRKIELGEFGFNLLLNANNAMPIGNHFSSPLCGNHVVAPNKIALFGNFGYAAQKINPTHAEAINFSFMDEINRHSHDEQGNLAQAMQSAQVLFDTIVNF